MDLQQVSTLCLQPAYSLLPERMASPAADAMLYAIGLQESRFTHRRQIGGPARGWWQFEQGGGVTGVLRHPASREHALRALDVLGYPESASSIHQVLADNDTLATVFARLLLWTDARALPARDAGADETWRYYTRNWRPGKPHRQTWDAHWRAAVEVTA